MFFSAKQYGEAIALYKPRGIYVAMYFNKKYRDERGREQWDTRNLTQKEIREALRAVKQQIVERKVCLHNQSGQDTGAYISKWLRPWEVLPELLTYTAPEGDYGVGVEVEMGFVSQAAAQQVAQHIANWKYVCLDFEGGEHPIEATFSPSKYSTFGGRSQVARYLDYLKANEELCEGHHAGARHVGTHVNVSKGGVRNYDMNRANLVSNLLSSLSFDNQLKYFGRSPYGYVYPQVGYLEYKLFKSTLDSKVMLRYVDIAVALTALITSDTRLTREAVMEALELGYNKRAKKQATPAVAATPVSLPLAA